jgi:AcrR family transcriptional regulator
MPVVPPSKIRTPALQSDLLRHAIDLLERDGPPAIRARDVAAAAGTSPAALYELFGNKAGLVRAMFLEGFRQLHDRLAAVPETPDPRADLLALLDASRAFAVEHPMLFEVMFARPFAEFDPSAEDRAVAVALYDLVVQRVGRWLDAVGSDLDRVDAAHALVATDRGLVADELAGVLGRSAASVRRRRHLTLAALMDGLASTAPSAPSALEGT